MLSIFKKTFPLWATSKGNSRRAFSLPYCNSLFEAFQLLALAVVLKALIENNMSGTTALLSFGIMLVSVVGTIITGHISHMSEVEGSYAACADRRVGIGDRMKYMPMGYFNSHSLGNITAAVTTTMSDVEEIGPCVMDKTVHGAAVVFRFFPTMRAGLKGLRDSMHNRGITKAVHLLRHPVSSFEYSLVSLLLRCLQIADQLSVSAVARGIEAPGKRTSYSEQKIEARDVICMLIWLIVTVAFLVVGGIG